MHIHIHHDPHGPERAIDAAACAAAGLGGHVISFGETAADFAAQAGTVEALVAPPWELKRLDLFAAPKLVLVQSTSAGVNHLLPFDMIPPHVLLLNNRGVHADKAGEYALMAILMLVNRLPQFVTDQRAGTWFRRTAGLAADHRLTIIGLGSLGGAAAQQARRLGMTITGLRHGTAPHPACHRTLSIATLDAVLPETDILLLACPLTPATNNLLSASRLALLPPGAGVINIGRGRLVDQNALFDALEAGRLGGAVLDVFHREPIPPGDRAWGVKNLIVTPHMSSDNPATYNADTLALFARNLAAHGEGRTPPTLVDRAKGY
jgi:phosphoglycerate dehydrogenase-like enzyme